MANLGQKDGIFHVRFRFRGKEYKKSLKTHDERAAEAACHVIELTMHRLLTGQLQVPPAVDPGDFIVSGGTLLKPVESPIPRVALPSTRQLADEYSTSVKNLLAPSYHYSQAMHLRHLVRHLGARADAPCDRIGFRDLDKYIKARLAVRHPNTAERERITLLQFYKWAVRQRYVPESPAAALVPIKGGEDRPPFRTISEINSIIERGGLRDAEIPDLWECLYLSPAEIAIVLATVRPNARVDYSFLLHAIPAYTGMRRGEILRLRWVDVDLADGYISARSRKQSRRKRETVRRIDLHPELKKELLAWRQQRPQGQHVICDASTLEPINNDRANRCFWQPMRHTQWCLDNTKDWFKIGFHTYRHSFASNLAAAGVDQRVIDEFMGHQTEGMRKRYRHLFPRDRRSAIESFSLVSRPEINPTQHPGGEGPESGPCRGEGPHE
jgi:integrase